MWGGWAAGGKCGVVGQQVESVGWLGSRGEVCGGGKMLGMQAAVWGDGEADRAAKRAVRGDGAVEGEWG